jgi:hypothetical protein
VTLWGEWEPPSRVTKRWRPEPDLPTYLHEPLLSPLPDRPKLQNTDPMVFGRAFRYSNCKQWHEKHGKPRGLQDLEPGSVILFGSKREGFVEFVLDAVLVVGSPGRPYAPRNPDALADESFLRQTIVEPLRTFGDRARGWAFTLLSGATPDDPVEEMYSFVPCKPIGDDGPQQFNRPVIDLPRFINPRNWRAQAGYTTRDRVPISDARDAWTEVVRQVRGQGCSLGFDLAEPPLRQDEF